MTFQWKAAILQTFQPFLVIIKGQLAYVSSTRWLTTGTKRVNCAGSAVEFGGVRLVKCGILATARCSACMNNECTGGGGGSGARAILQTTERSCLFVQCPSTDVKRF